MRTIVNILLVLAPFITITVLTWVLGDMHQAIAITGLVFIMLWSVLMIFLSWLHHKRNRS